MSKDVSKVPTQHPHELDLDTTVLFSQVWTRHHIVRRVNEPLPLGGLTRAEALTISSDNKGY